MGRKCIAICRRATGMDRRKDRPVAELLSGLCENNRSKLQILLFGLIKAEPHGKKSFVSAFVYFHFRSLWGHSEFDRRKSSGRFVPSTTNHGTCRLCILSCSQPGLLQWAEVGVSCAYCFFLCGVWKEYFSTLRSRAKPILPYGFKTSSTKVRFGYIAKKHLRFDSK